MTVVVPVLALGPAAVAVGALTHWAAAVFAGGIMSFCTARDLLLTRRGVVEAWPDGLATRMVGRRTEVCWERVERLVVVPTFLGRRLAIDDRAGRRTTLAAPRSGLLLRGAAFSEDLERLRTMPGGERISPPVFTAPALSSRERTAQLAVVVMLAIISWIALST